MKKLLVGFVLSIVATAPAMAAPGFANDVCGASKSEVAFVAAENRAQFLRYLIRPEHAEVLERMQGMQARTLDSPAKITGKMVREALSGVKRAAVEAFAGNDEMSLEIYSQHSVPQLHLYCASSSKSGFSGVRIPLNGMFLGNNSQQIEVVVLPSAKSSE